MIWPDGSVHWLEARGRVFKNDNDEPVRITGVNMEVTERKRQEGTLRASEQRWRTLTEALPQLVWTDLPDGECDWLSSQWRAYTGITEDQLLGLRWLDAVIHPDDRERTLLCWEAACADQGDYDLEYRIKRHDGEYHWFKTRGVPMRDDEGTILFWVGTCTDIEDVKRLEAALRETDRRKDEFLAILAHELRNPLAPIRNAVELLRHAGDDHEVKETARRMMERQLGHMVRLIDDLMDISRITRGKFQLRREPIELSAVLQSAIEETRPFIEASNHALTLRIPPESVYLDADSTRLSQVFSNLLNNAAKYTENGGHIWLTVDQPDGEVLVTVRDTGIGIEADHLTRVFEMFSQATPALDRSQGGLGIGLALVRGLVELHGGTVEARSRGPNLGSEFTVRLPTVDGPLEKSSPSKDSADPIGTGRTCRILVVDDNADAASSMAMILRRMGHEVQLAHDGLEAVQAATSFHPEVVLLDIGLPKLNGYEAAKQIRRLLPNHRLVLIALSGWAQEEDKRRALEAGFDQHLTKPVEPEELSRLLSLILS